MTRKETIELSEDCISREKGMITNHTMLTLRDFLFGKSDAPCSNCCMDLQPEAHTGWIPVSKKLPKAGEYVGNTAKYYLVQNEYGDMLVARYTHSGYWEQIYQHKPYADKIVAWRELPQPCMAGSEVRNDRKVECRSIQ